MFKDSGKNTVKKSVTTLVTVSILFICAGFFTGCKTPQKVITETLQNEKKDIAKDITVLDNSQLYEEISSAVQTGINEKFQLSISKKVYDTAKPVDPQTGKHPLKAQSNISMTKDIGIQKNDTTKTVKKSVNNSLFTDKTKDKGKMQAETKTEQETGISGWQKTALKIIAVILLCFATYRMIK